MQICSDLLEATRSVGSNQPGCASSSAYYPTTVPYTTTSLCANSKLIQRLQHKIDLYQTPSSNDARQILQRLTNIIRQHVPSFVFNEIPSDDARKQISQIGPLPSNNCKIHALSFKIAENLNV